MVLNGSKNMYSKYVHTKGEEMKLKYIEASKWGNADMRKLKTECQNNLLKELGTDLYGVH